jgi:hypothetical protein
VTALPLDQAGGAVEAVLADVGRALAADDGARATGLLDAGVASLGHPELLLMRGPLAYFTTDWEAACSYLERAVRAFQEAGRPRRAALAASWVGRVYEEGISNHMAARGWFARAERLLEGQGPCPERGWVAVALIGCVVSDVEVLEVLLAAHRRARVDEHGLLALDDHGVHIELAEARQGEGRGQDPGVGGDADGVLHGGDGHDALLCDRSGGCAVPVPRLHSGGVHPAAGPFSPD